MGSHHGIYRDSSCQQTLFLPPSRVVRTTLNVIVHRLVRGDEKQFAGAARPVNNKAAAGPSLVFPLPTTHGRDDLWPQRAQVSRQCARAELDASAAQGKWET
jgi:hypothetical protein